MFSVVIPAYNCENTIERVLDSVLNQTRVDLIEEIIVINDGSKDRSGEIIKRYIDSHGEETVQILYLERENRGVSYTRNQGIRMAKAEWIALLDSDDRWKKNKIERQYQMIKGTPDICFLGSSKKVKFLFSKKKGLCKLSAKQLCIRSIPAPTSVVFKKTAGIELGLFDVGMSYSEDINFFQKFLLKDSYFILAEDLIELSIDKKFYIEKGLSSNLYQMHMGRNKNTKDLYEMKLIGYGYYLLMMGFNWLKFIRRISICQLEKYIRSTK